MGGGSAHGILYRLTPSTFYYQAAIGRCSTMNEFLTSFSSDHTLLWALLIVGVIAASAIGLHLFWIMVFRSWAALRARPGNRRGHG